VYDRLNFLGGTLVKRRVAFVCIAASVLLAAACSSDDTPKTTPNPTAKPQSLDCAWPMFGRSAARTFAYPADCHTALGPESVPRLQQDWFYKTADVVTATPAIADNRA
jgi:hypothetical protein